MKKINSLTQDETWNLFYLTGDAVSKTAWIEAIDKVISEIKLDDPKRQLKIDHMNMQKTQTDWRTK